MGENTTRANLKLAIEDLSQRDPDLKRFYLAFGLPELRSRRTGYGTLVKIICSQQVSTAAARAISGRLDAIAEPMTPEVFLRIPEKIVRETGLSRQKIAYARGIAEAIINGHFSFRKIASMEDDLAVEEMVKLKGVGKWTAEIYLLFALRRPDIWPVDDLGIIKGLMGLKGLSSRPSPEQMMRLGEEYRPWRSAAARMMWHYTNIARSTKNN